MDKKVVGISVVLVFGIVSVCLFNAFINVESEPEDKLSAIRNISKSEVKAGGNFTVTVTITALQYVEAPALDEDLPDGWTVTPISSDGGYFKASTTEWIWTISMNEGETKQVVYRVDVPSDAEPGIYNINGHVSAYGISPIEVEGDNQIVNNVTKLSAIIAMPSKRIGKNVPHELDLWLTIYGESVAAIDINITYDPTIINITSAEKGDFDGFAYNIYEGGKLRVAAYQTGATGLSGNVTIAKIEIIGIGNYGQSTTLHIKVNELVNNTGAPLPYEIINGSIEIGLKGDFSGDGKVTIWDCTYLARYLVGIPGYEKIYAVDISGDFKVTIWDCTYLARYLVGIPSYELDP